MQIVSQHPYGFGLKPSFENIPDPIKSGHWCVWIAHPRNGRKDKWDKVPHNGVKWISVAKPDDWLTYGIAVQLYRQFPHRFNGIGRLVESNDEFNFLDIDDKETAEKYIALLDTYWEESPSGEGARGICTGDLHDTNKPFEIYTGDSPRFVTITGRPLNGTTINDLSGELASCAGVAQAKAERADHPKLIDFTLPYPLSEYGLEQIPPDCDRSAEMMRVANKMFHGGLNASQVFSFLAQTDWMRVALDHRRQDYAGALDYLWGRVEKAKTYTEEPLEPPSFEAISYSPAEGDKPWQPLLDELDRKPPRYNPDLWPALLRDYVKEIHTNTGMDSSAPAFAGLWSLSACLDHRSSVSIRRDWREPMIVWACLIGDPAAMKTPATRPFTGLLSDIEHEHNKVYAAQLEAYEAAKRRYERTEEENPLTKPAKPISMCLVVNDGTGQGMRNVLSERPRGCAVYYDEMSDFVTKQATANREHPDRGFWLQGYSGGRHATALVNQGFIGVQNIAIPMLGCIQPNVLRPLGKNLKSDGMIQRFIPVPLLDRVLPGINVEVPEFLSVAPKWDALLRYYLSRQPFELRLSHEVKKRLWAFQEWLYGYLVARRYLHMSDGHTTALGKAAGLLVRLAGLFHLIERREGSLIGEEEFNRAHRLLREYIIPSQDYLYTKLFGHGEENYHMWLFDSVLVWGKEIITARDIKRYGRRRPEFESKTDRERSQTVLDGMGMLESFGVVKQVSTNNNPHSLQWWINPKTVQDQQDRIERRKEMQHRVKQEILKGLETRKDDE